jgi:peptide/nickel transport system substrate-binding protein
MDMIKGLKHLIGALAITSALVTSAHAANLRWGFQGGPASLDPYTVNETFTLGLLGNVYEGLVRRDRNFVMQPALAERWENPEPTRWRFYLRKGVKFHNGDDFTADDLIFSAARARSETSNLGNRIPRDAEFRKIDDYTVDVILKEPNSAMMVEWDTFFMFSKKWAEANNATQPSPPSAGSPSFATLNANGTGAFTVVRHEPGVRTMLRANPNWWAKKEHNIDQVEMAVINNDSTRVAALLSGEVDGIDPVPLQDTPRVQSAQNLKLLSGTELRTISFGFDQSRDELTDSNVKGKNPFKDVRVREAFYRAVDPSVIHSRIMRGFGQPVTLPVSPQVFPPAASFTRPTVDLDQAKKLLAEAGYPSGFEVGLDCPNDRFINDSEICQAVASQVARIGIKIRLNATPKAQYFAKVLKSAGYKTSFFLIGWYDPDAARLLYNLYNCRDVPGRGDFNFGGYCNRKVDELTAAALSQSDEAKREQIVKEAYEIVMRDFAYITVQQQPLLSGVSKKVEMVQRPDNHFYFFWMNKSE